MGYKVVIKTQARKKLISLPTLQRVKIAEKIEWLGKNPDDQKLDIKKLVGQNFYRLRIVNWRVIFDRDDIIKIISVEALKPRGDAYK